MDLKVDYDLGVVVMDKYFNLNNYSDTIKRIIKLCISTGMYSFNTEKTKNLIL